MRRFMLFMSLICLTALAAGCEDNNMVVLMCDGGVCPSSVGNNTPTGTGSQEPEDNSGPQDPGTENGPQDPRPDPHDPAPDPHDPAPDPHDPAPDPQDPAPDPLEPGENVHCTDNSDCNGIGVCDLNAGICKVVSCNGDECLSRFDGDCKDDGDCIDGLICDKNKCKECRKEWKKCIIDGGESYLGCDDNGEWKKKNENCSGQYVCYEGDCVESDKCNDKGAFRCKEGKVQRCDGIWIDVENTCTVDGYHYCEKGGVKFEMCDDNKMCVFYGSGNVECISDLAYQDNISGCSEFEHNLGLQRCSLDKTKILKCEKMASNYKWVVDGGNVCDVASGEFCHVNMSGGSFAFYCGI